jgi:hypothetical protein
MVGSHIEHLFAKFAITLLAEQDLSKRIAAMGVETRREEDKLGLKVSQSRGQGFLKVVEEIAVGTAGGDGNIQRQTLSRAESAFTGGTGAGIMRILVDAKKEHRFVGLKGVLGTIAVVDVPIDDRHALNPAFGAQIMRGDRHIIKKTKAHYLVEFGVVARRPNTAEGVVGAPGEDGVDGCNWGSRCQQRGPVGAWRTRSIRGNLNWPVYLVECRDLVEMGLGMDSEQGFPMGFARL